MKDKIIKLIFLIISLLIMLLGIHPLLIRQEYIIAFECFLFALLLNPFIMKCLIDRNNTEEKYYMFGYKVGLCICGVLISFIVAVVVFGKSGVGNTIEAEENFDAILKICVFVTYFLIIYLCVSENKVINYTIFGVFYFFCIALSFFSTSLTNEFIKILNIIPDSNMDIESYGLLTKDFIVPIKEAILTYIIFDTVFDNSKILKDKAKGIEPVDSNVFPI